MISLRLKQEISDILSNNFQTKIEVQDIEVLSEEARRNLVLRISVKHSSSNIPKTIIFKQSLLDKSIKDDTSVLARFARDGAGLEFISSLNTEESISPKFYGGSIKNRFILIQDLGNNLLSLVDPLMGNDLSAAIEALNRYMLSMARFHGLAYKNNNDYFKNITEYLS
jgi:hypothetical protein